MMEGGMKIVKYLIFFFNFLFWLSGLGVIIAGALVQTKYNKLFSFLESGFKSAPILLIVVGCIIAIIGFFGCCGAIKENYCMIMTFAVLLSTIFILEIAAGITAYVLRKEVENIVVKTLHNHIEGYNSSDPDAPVTSDMDFWQTEFKCCGIFNITDWDNFAAQHNGQYPASCCKHSPENLCKTNDTNFQFDGCLDKLQQAILDNLAIIIGVGVGIAFIQVFGVVLACCLGRGIRKDYEIV